MSTVRVGTSVSIIKHDSNGQPLLLLGRRKGSHQAGIWSTPGGHLDFGEEWQECALQEVSEECGNNLRI